MPSQTGITEGPAAFFVVAGGALGENRAYFRARMVQPPGAFVWAIATNQHIRLVRTKRAKAGQNNSGMSGIAGNLCFKKVEFCSLSC
jgi:hypothetical protein